jgi:hypothetical protein
LETSKKFKSAKTCNEEQLINNEQLISIFNQKNTMPMEHFTKNSDQNGKIQNILAFNPIKIPKIRIKMPLDPIKAENSM